MTEAKPMTQEMADALRLELPPLLVEAAFATGKYRIVNTETEVEKNE